jgi:hypothetical protein
MGLEVYTQHYEMYIVNVYISLSDIFLLALWDLYNNCLVSFHIWTGLRWKLKSIYRIVTRVKLYKC